MSLGPVVCARDRRYGRTWVRVFAGADMLGDVLGDEVVEGGEVAHIEKHVKC
jgi:hypothetical protein